MKRVPITPRSWTSILLTPGAMYHLSTTAEVSGGFSLKPSTTCPLYTEMRITIGVWTFIFLNLSMMVEHAEQMRERKTYVNPTNTLIESGHNVNNWQED